MTAKKISLVKEKIYDRCTAEQLEIIIKALHEELLYVKDLAVAKRKSEKK